MKSSFEMALAMAMVMVCSTYTFADAAADYKAKCAMCHGRSGAGDTVIGKNMKLADLGSAGVQKLSDSELAGIIAKGKGKMPAQEGKLSKEQINDLVRWIRALKK
jgi:mono/diheme cytochrome c family protein